jgi:hypothetical protein
MDFNRPVKLKINSTEYLDLNSLANVRAGSDPLSGYKLESANYAAVQTAGYVDKAALRDGVTVTESYLGGRNIDMVVSVYGNTIGDFWDRIDAISSATQPMPQAFSSNYGVRPLRFYQPTWNLLADFPDGIELDMNVRPVSLPVYGVSRRNSIGKPKDGFSQPVQLRFLAPDPRKTLSAARALASAYTTHRGSATVYPLLTKTSCTAGDTVTFSWSGGGTSSIVQATVIADGSISIDTNTMQQTNCRVVHANTSGDLLVYPGTVTIGDTHTATATLTLTIRVI